MRKLPKVIINKLLLQNFRNYSKREFEFSKKTNLIIGPNAVGKTNILEAIYLLASGRCFRVKGVEREAIKYNEEIGRVNGKITEGLEEPEEPRFAKASQGEPDGLDLEIVLTIGEVGGEKTAKKRYFVNGVGKRQIDFLGNLRAVYFGPEDLDLITDSPGLRRKYLDMVLYQTDREYARAHLSYEKGLRSRNKILEDFRKKKISGGIGNLGGIDRRRLFFWDQLLIKNGNIITRKREEYIEFLNNVQFTDYNFSRQLRDFVAIQQFSIDYDRSTISEERLAKYALEEEAAGMTLVGPQRDDFKIKIYDEKGDKGNGGEQREKGRDLSVFGSRGEQRLAVLWLKLGELQFIKKQSGDLPVLLLDDIFSELDVAHRKLVFGLIGKHQTIITTADRGMVDQKWLKEINLIELE